MWNREEDKEGDYLNHGICPSTYTNIYVFGLFFLIFGEHDLRSPHRQGMNLLHFELNVDDLLNMCLQF